MEVAGEQVTYNPEPMDTSGVTLADGLQDLVEVLARNTHDLWARKRIADGWVHGPRRDDTARTHPNLVPYDDLAESEKEYDRGTVVEALKAITTLGYRITREERRTP